MDVFGITYIIENAQQFWSELEDIAHIPNDCTLAQLDSTLRRFITFCASYHEQYLQTPLQLEHSCDILLSSELFAFHSERMCELLMDDAKSSTDPHCQLILYNILLAYGRRKSDFLRSHKRWRPVIPLLMDHVLLQLDLDIDYAFGGATSRGLATPIEVKLQLFSIGILYEVCRVQKLSIQDLKIFDDAFIEHLFQLVEDTRDQQDETFNYAVIKLIVALNEQFMVASIQPHSHHEKAPALPEQKPEAHNRVLRVLMARLGTSMTFGENMIFMLNRAGRTPEDLVMQLLVLKILYLLFTTKGTTEYFYTNDLCVLVDVFLREIVNLDEDNESLRHTYLRVLHPLLTKTQLRTMAYKRPQIVHVLESLIENENIRDVNPTTKRLVLRCLTGEWCVQFRKAKPTRSSSLSTADSLPEREHSPGVDSISSAVSPISASTSNTLLAVSDTAHKAKPLKSSRSAENLQARPSRDRERPGGGLRPDDDDNASSTSLPRVAAASAASISTRRRDRAGSMDVEAPSTSERRTTVLVGAALTQDPPEIRVQASSPLALDEQEPRILPASLPSSPVPRQRRTAPAPPPRRRKPPAVPIKSSSGTTFTTIASSTSSRTQSLLGLGAGHETLQENPIP